MSKPFFFRIESADLLNFATDPEGEGMSLLRFAKELQKGESEIEFIQDIIDEARNYIEKKKKAGSKGGKAKASSAIAVLGSAVAKPITPLASSSTEAVTVHKPKPLSKNKSPLPENFQVSERVKLWAKEKSHNITPDDLEDFTLHHRKVGSKFVDWDSALMTWMRNKRKFNKDTSPDGPRGKRLN